MDPRLDCSQCVRGPFSREFLHHHPEPTSQPNVSLNGMGQLNHIFPAVPSDRMQGHMSVHERHHHHDAPAQMMETPDKAVDFSGIRAQMEQSMRWRSVMPNPPMYGTERDMRHAASMESAPYFNLGEDLMAFSDPSRYQYSDMRGFRMFSEPPCQPALTTATTTTALTPGEKLEQQRMLLPNVPVGVKNQPSSNNMSGDSMTLATEVLSDPSMSHANQALNSSLMTTFPVPGTSSNIPAISGQETSSEKNIKIQPKKEKPVILKGQRKPPKKKVVRKRKKDIESWKRNKNKKLKNQGLEYTGNNGKVVPAKSMGSGCSQTCRYRCHRTFSEEERQAIFTRFWSLGDITAQRQFIINRVEKIKPIRPTGKDAQPSRRTKTFMYSLTKDESDYRVCKTFFLHTLGVKEDIVFGAFRKLDDDGLLTPDMRGKHTSHKKADEDISEMIRQIIHGHFGVDTEEDNSSFHPDSKMTHRTSKDTTKDDTDITGRRKAKKRGRHEENWKRVKFKKLKNKGLPYTSGSGKLVSAKCQGPGCGENCRFRCHQVFPNDVRQNIFHRFWRLGDITAQRQYIVKYVDKVKPKRPTLKDAAVSRRTKTLLYHLGKEGKDYKVCKKFFLDTLGIKEDIVFGAFRKLNDTGIVAPDLRGKHTNHKKVDEATKEMIRQHILSFPTVPCPPGPGVKGKHYLDHQMNITKMYQMYAECCKEMGVSPANMSMYRYIFHAEFNLAFHTVKKSQPQQQQLNQQPQQQTHQLQHPQQQLQHPQQQPQHQLQQSHYQQQQQGQQQHPQHSTQQLEHQQQLGLPCEILIH